MASRAVGFGGGGSPTPNEIGDTARPHIHPKRRASCRLARLSTDVVWCAFGDRRELWRGYWDTDGLGHHCFYRVKRVSKVYGVPIEKLYIREINTQPKQDVSHTTRSRRRRARLHRIVRWLRRYPGSTKWDVAKRFSVSSATAWHDLACLRYEGRVRSVTASNGNKGQENSKWWAE